MGRPSPSTLTSLVGRHKELVPLFVSRLCNYIKAHTRLGFGISWSILIVAGAGAGFGFGYQLAPASITHTQTKSVFTVNGVSGKLLACQTQKGLTLCLVSGSYQGQPLCVLAKVDISNPAKPSFELKQVANHYCPGVPA